MLLLSENVTPVPEATPGPAMATKGSQLYMAVQKGHAAHVGPSAEPWTMPLRERPGAVAEAGDGAVVAAPRGVIGA